MTKEERNELTDLLHCATDYFLAQSRPTVLEDAQRAVAAHAALKKAGQILSKIKPEQQAEPKPEKVRIRITKVRKGVPYRVGEEFEIRERGEACWTFPLGNRLYFVDSTEAEELPAEEPEPEQDGEWIEWRGGECPVRPGVKVDVILQNGSQLRAMAGELYWCDAGYGEDIIRYRVLP